ncbi:RNA polymerase sigma factor [Paraburkholderia sp. ZP32-5]|uniref:RNA polymerase sigma factor n=1 Tax=Paraburkholderia sp. ZP32-5 TaxID=2883245 RepID=UPI002DD44CA8|nr:RNA polymerase sigma factor [Paraburkholderia sp. ZP32-5]
MVQTESDAARTRAEPDADAARSRRFQQLALPHLDAAYNLARWLCGNPNDADDVVQEAFMRAFRFFDTFRGESARPWLLAIVRRTWYTEWRRRAPSHDMLEFDETMDEATFDGWSAGGDDPQTLLIRDEDARQVHEALAQLPVEYREVLILRELEEMGYREIAVVADVPIGTVMSRLARGRRKLAQVLMAERGAGTSAGAGRGEGAGAGARKTVSRGAAAQAGVEPPVGHEGSGGSAGAEGAADGRPDQGGRSGRAMQSSSSAPLAGRPAPAVLFVQSAPSLPLGPPTASMVSVSSASSTQSARPGRSKSEGCSARAAPGAPATATITQLRAFADGRPLNIPGAAADPAKETPDGL